MKNLGKTYKQIILKVQNANTLSIKLLRKDVALRIMKAHTSGFDFIYIDEVSFNIDLRIKKGWSKSGSPQKVPTVSK